MSQALARVYRILAGFCCGLGFLSLVAAAVLRLVPVWAEGINTAPGAG